MCPQEKVDKIKFQGYSTYTAHALNTSVEVFQSSSRFHYHDVIKVLIVLTDGNSSDKTYLRETAQYVRSLGILPFVVGVGSAFIEELKVIANGGESMNRVYKVKTFKALKGIVEDLYKEINSMLLDQGDEVDNITTTISGLKMSQFGSSTFWKVIS